MAFISSVFLSELTFQRSSVVKVVVKGMTSSFQFSVHKNIGPQTAVGCGMLGQLLIGVHE